MVKEDIKLPPRTVVSEKGRLMTAKRMRKGTLQLVPVEGKGPEENEITLCEAVVEAAELVPITIVNQAHKTIKVKRGEEMGKALPLRTLNRVKFEEKQGKHVGQPEGIADKEILAPDQFRARVGGLLRNNGDVVAKSDKELGQTHTVKMTIDTGDHPPVKLKPYRTPVHKRPLVEEAVEEMLEAGMIERSISPWSFPIMIVSKKDGGHRFCVDFRKLNSISKPSAVPLPLINDILALLGKAKYFSTLDLRSGYWQVALDEADKEKAAFACHLVLFQFRVMPFGLANAPGICRQLIVLGGCESFAIAYLDDILIFSETVEQHFFHLKQVLGRLRKHGLKLKSSKCRFLKEETRYLGFVINGDSIKPDMDKVKVIREMP